MKQWYLLAYDVRDKKRLRRLHYALKKQALPLQQSVFLVQADKKRLKFLVGLVKSRTATNLDDVRVYPLHHPNDMWLGGCQQQALAGLFAGKPDKKASVTVLQRVKNLFGGKASGRRK